MKKYNIKCPIFFTGILILVITLFLFQYKELFTTIYYAESDYAANSILVQNAMKFELFTGNYSRIGFYHPGPFFFYLMAFFELILFKWFHFFPGSYNAEIFAMITYSAFCITITLSFFKKEFNLNLSYSLFLLLLLLILYKYNTNLEVMWPPFWYTYTFLPFTVSYFFLIYGKYDYLPWYILFISILVHGHVCFSLFCFLTLGLLLVEIYIKEKNQLRKFFIEQKINIIKSILIAFIFILPIAIETVINFPGQIPFYLGYSENNHSSSIKYSLLFLFKYYLIYGKAFFSFVIILLLLSYKLEKNKKIFFYSLFCFFFINIISILYIYRGLDSLEDWNIYTNYYIYSLYTFIILVNLCNLYKTINQFVPKFVITLVLTLLSLTLIHNVNTSQKKSYTGNTVEVFTSIKKHINRLTPHKEKKVFLVLAENDVWPKSVELTAYNIIYDNLELYVSTSFGYSKALECMFTPNIYKYDYYQQANSDFIYVYVTENDNLIKKLINNLERKEFVLYREGKITFLISNSKLL